ncbi:MAG: ubiquinol-cytochrome c reductase iron-sulfur subunit [Actinomycetes bacterium]
MTPDHDSLDETRDPKNPLARRTVLRSAALAGVAGAALAACGSDDSGGGGSSGGGSSNGTAEQDSGGGGSAAGGGTSVAASDIPVGGGEVLKKEKLVVAQPTKGTFTAFTAVCTHMGCLVNEVKDGTITCPCHGSQYSAEDGSVVGGPAPSPLKSVKTSVSGGEVTLG